MGFRRYMKKNDASLLPLTPEQVAEIRALQFPARLKLLPPKPVREDSFLGRDGRIKPKPESDNVR